MKVELEEIYKEIYKEISGHKESLKYCETREEKLPYQVSIDSLNELKRTLMRKYRG